MIKDALPGSNVRASSEPVTIDVEYLTSELGGDPRRYANLFKNLVDGLSRAEGDARMSDDAGRKAAAAALLSVIAFLEKMSPSSLVPFGQYSEIVAPFYGLFNALRDVEQGRENQMLKPRAIKHARPQSTAQTLKRAYAAATVDRLIALDMAISDANESVARALKVLSRQEISAKVVAGWRNELGRRNDAIAVGAREALSRQFEEMQARRLTSSSPDDCLRVFVELVRKLGPEAFLG